MLRKVTFVIFLMRGVAKKDAFDGFRIKLAPKLVVNMNKVGTTKDF